MDKINEVLNRGVEKVYPSKKALEKVLRSGKKIRLYQGFDPSMPNLHLGNMVGILKLKQFQDLGHEVIFLVGDFTGMIGDPTDKSTVRKKLTRKQVLKNCQTWKSQAGKTLKLSGKNPVRWLFNSQWLDKMALKELIEIASNFTAQQMLERDFFQKRLKENKPIFLHEFLYPIAVSIDCVEMNVDLEVGGNDQTFNMLAGRTLMKAIKGKEKFVLTTKLLVDAQGEKVGKTTGNALFLNASPSDMFGGIMSFPDEVIVLSFELLTQLSMKKVQNFQKSLRSPKTNPMDIKKQLAFEIVKMYHHEKKAKLAQREFERVFQKRKVPVDVNELKLKNRELNIVDLLMKTKLVKSRGEAKRLVKQGGVDVDGKTINYQSRFHRGSTIRKSGQSQPKTGQPLAETINLKSGMIIRVGKKKFVKIRN